MKDSQRRVVISGATSCTGAAIAIAFADAGWHVDALVRSRIADYHDLKRARLALLEARGVPLHEGVEATAMASFLRAHPADVLVYHHHHMADYRSPNYDRARAIAVGAAPARAIVEAFQAGGGHALIHSGSFSEPREGGRPNGAPVSPYGQSKADVSEALAAAAAAARVPFGKVVISDPVGPYENIDRLLPTIIRAARAREAVSLVAGDATSDWIPIESLATCYVQLAQAVLEQPAPRTIRPSGWSGLLTDWVAEVSRALIVERLQLEAPVVNVKAAAGGIMLTQPREQRVAIDWPAFWDRYAAYVQPR